MAATLREARGIAAQVRELTGLPGQRPGLVPGGRVTRMPLSLPPC